MDLSSIGLACLSLDSSTCADIVCGSNGLPLTPNSIRIIGEFKAHIEHIEHPNLVKYVECFRNKNERVSLVYENLLNLNKFTNLKNLNFLQITKQLLDALNYLHININTVHGLITPECIVSSSSILTTIPTPISGDCCDHNIKLLHWPINLLTNGGLFLGATTILPQDISFLPPEQIKNPTKQPTQQSDIWSAGLSLLKILKQSNCKLPENPCRLAFCDTPNQILDLIDGNLDDNNIPNSSLWNEFFKKVLHPNPNLRASIDELYELLNIERDQVYKKNTLERPLEVNYFESIQAKLSNLDISEIYYLWRLSIGRNFESEQKLDDCPPIIKIPYLIETEKPLNQQVTETKLKNHIIVETNSKLIPLDKFKKDVRQLDTEIFHPLILTDEDLITSIEDRYSNSSEVVISATNTKECNNNRKISDAITFADLDGISLRSSTIQNESSNSRTSSKRLPVVIKEADFAYQCERIVLFKRLLAGYPYLKEQLNYEASVDIPPYYRAQIWAILLDVCPARSKLLYEKIDKTTPIATDRQISVDIPRCHQYNELMASPQGHRKLARILKAWLNYNSDEYVYWQGLDSLAAPFLLLNFDNEALAFACFNAFVNKYLKGFFKKDNQSIVQHYLDKFSELLLYHDPSLASHLEKLNFLPNLYAIPWFLTMFTHVLPLHKVLHVWDRLLLGNEKFPLCIGLAILNQLRQELMNFNFNDCIVAFSDMPEIDIERCVRDASRFYNSTPESL